MFSIQSVKAVFEVDLETVTTKLQEDRYRHNLEMEASVEEGPNRTEWREGFRDYVSTRAEAGLYNGINFASFGFSTEHLAQHGVRRRRL